MSIRKCTRTTLIVFSLSVFFFGFFKAPQVGAFSLPGVFGGVKDFLTGGPTKQLTIDSKIELAGRGDLNNNGHVDAGDTITFSYTISNPTDKEYSFATLKTNIPRNYLNFIHNIHGASSLSDKNNSIVIPNLRINPGQTLTIQFDARVNYFSDADKSIVTEPEIISFDKKSLFKSSKKEIRTRLWKGKLPSNIELKKKL